ncbi:MAG: 5'-methylthioadenosine/adenosylhomocysteine nucleosidase [Lachnobacterium sp.]|nr:5'-methylthioadenosine/adenosylhomocysteine nucleosidase [Lachnobacterium sp.]MDD6633513.1 5'-methylthioadenosine/adenosylhomocysteine nucleosidase [Lachnobacterium sp.]MDY2911346.1 5'-methylthioadenosine/adenosylhomocysteine nucleosidase [Agathobacter sp.]
MRIGVIGAMQMEVDNLKAVMEDVTTETYSGVEFVSGKYASKDVVVAKCGIGKVFAAICAEAMILKFDVDKIINIGVAGSLTKDLGVLDVAVANNVVQHDMDTSPLGDPVGLLSGINMVTLDADKDMNALLCDCLSDKGIKFKKGTIATGDQFVATKEQKDRITGMFDAIAAEMEGGSIGHVCYINNIPFAILRSISDSEGGAIDYQTFAEKAADQSIEVVKEFIARV